MKLLSWLSPIGPLGLTERVPCDRISPHWACHTARVSISSSNGTLNLSLPEHKVGAAAVPE